MVAVFGFANVAAVDADVALTGFRIGGDPKRGGQAQRAVETGIGQWHGNRIHGVIMVAIDVDFLDGPHRYDDGVDGMFLGIDPAVEDLFLPAPLISYFL